MLREPTRTQVLTRLGEVIGEDEATELMEAFPNFDWNELATKDDINSFKETTDTLQVDVRTLQTDFAIFRESVDAKFEAQTTLIRTRFPSPASYTEQDRKHLVEGSHDN